MPKQDISRFPHQLPPNTIVLPHWQTPAFCRAALEAGTVHGKQAERYKAIAAGHGWGKYANYELVWQEENEPRG